jgi:dTDP-4-dehydrorhamnose reductase
MKSASSVRMNESFLVVGSGGRLGKSLLDHLALSRSAIGLARADMDLTNPETIRSVLDGLDFNHVVLTAALTGVDYCETHRDEAFAINADAAGLIAEIAAARGARMTYISTDMVFDGLKDCPYVETDPAVPANVYGESKLEGEHRVLAASDRNLVARVSWVYGPARPAFPEWIIGRACAEDDLTLPGDKICCPTYTLDLIGWLDALWSTPAAGVFHLCNSVPCSWRDWGQACIDIAREQGWPVRTGEIRPVSVDSVAAFVAKRALNTAMDTSHFVRTTGVSPRHWREALREFVVQSPTFSSYKTP